MAKANGTFTYPMSSQKNIADAGSNYDNILSEFSTGTAFRDVTVNPILKTTHVDSENITSSVTSVPSAIFTEIRKGPHDSSISNDSNTGIGNRILPVNTTLSDYGIARDNSAPFKIKVYSSDASGDTNRKFVYNTQDSPDTDTLGIDIDNYDYFILLNPSIIQDTSSTTQTSVRPHFAKVTGITSFNEFGDGLEFSPKYPVPIPKGTQFEVFKGPAKTATDVVAVSYGLRGDANANTDNYDVLNFVSKPTFYFYNDRLEQSDQLDYMEKYTLTRLRWFSTLTNITITDTDAHTKYQEGSSSVRFEVANSTHTDILCEGMSIFNSSNVFLGNIKDITGNFFQLDFARIAISADTSNSQTYKIGRGIQNIVFRTEARIKGTIPNKGRQKLDAVLVDNLRNTDNSDNNFNPSFWRKAFVNMRRHEQDSTTATVDANHFDGELNGPARYITSDPRPFRNDKISPMSDIIVNSPRNRMSKIAKMIGLNNSGMLPHKIQRGQKLKVLHTKFSDKTTMKELPVLASKTTGANTITFTQIDSAHDYQLSEKLPVNSIIEIGDYHYVVQSFASKSSGSQVLTTKARKTKTENTFSSGATVHEFTNLVPKVVFWTGVLNTDGFDSETDVIYADNHRLSVSDSTINKENTKFYNSRITFNSLSHHENLVDFIDRNMQYVKIQDANRKFYQSSNIQRFYYYDNSFSLQQEAFSGIVESTDNTTENGLSTMIIEGRDNSSALLNKLVNRNLNHTEDMLFSSLNPVLPQVGDVASNVSVFNTASSPRTGKITWPTSSGDKNAPKHSIAVMTTGEIVGEVESKATVGSNYEVTLKHAAIHSGSNKNVRFIDPYRFANYLSGVKALSSNPQITSTTDFKGVSDKGVVFQDSVSFFRADDGTLSTRKLEGASNTVDTVGATSNSSIHKLGSFVNNRTLGFDIGETISIDELSSTLSSADSVFGFKPVNESGVDTEDISIMSLASESYDVVSFESKDDGGATMEIAPRCPLVLGRVVNNEDDTRSSHSFYLLNTPINNGGFLHRLTRHTLQKIYTSDHAYRYWDLQKFSDGTLIGKDAGIYKSASKINSYAISHPIDTDGTLGSSTYIADNRPLLGSNFLDDDLTMLNTASGPFVDDGGGADKTPPQKSLLTRTSTVGSTVPISSSVLKNIDDKAQVYEIYSTGDLYPYSKLRYNNLSANTLEFSQLGCLLQSEGTQSATVVNHRDYDGTTRMTDIRDGNFEAVPIKSATKTTDQLKRFGIARLVEATFDWHFNPVDSDNLPTPEESEVTFLTYQMFKARTPATNLTLSIANVGNTFNIIQLQHTTGSSITLSAGDAIFRVDTGEMVGYKKSGSDITIASGSAVAINSVNNTWQAMSGYLNTSDGVTNVPVYISPEYRNLTFTSPIFKGVLKDEEIDNQKEGKTDLTSIFLVRPNYESTGFSFANLRGDDVTTTLSGTYAAGSTSLFLANASNFSSAGVGEVNGVRVRWSSKSGNTLTLDTNADDNFFYLNKQQVSSGTSIIEYKDNFDAPNILFPIVFHTLRSASNQGNTDISPYHPDYAWSSHADFGTENYYHSSRVLASNVSNKTTSSGLVDLDKFGYSDDANPYNNCIGVFRNIRKVSTSGPNPDMIQTSARLGVNTTSDYTNWLGASDISSTQVYQNTRNTIAFQEGSNYYSLSGINSMRKDMVSSVNNRNITFLESLEDEQVSGKRETYHRDATTSGGGIYKAQMLVKPFLDTGDSNVSVNDGLGQDSKTLTINIESNTSQHNWLSYVPNLTGYYLVPETGYDNLNQVTNGAIFNPSLGATDPAMLGSRRELNSTGIIRIESHTQGQVSFTDPTIDHVIVGSSAFDSDMIYRLMRFAETTLRDTPNEIILNRLHYTGLDYSLTPSSFRTGKTKAVRHFDEKLAEGVLSMYVVLNTDTLGGSSLGTQFTSSMLFSVNPQLAHAIIGCDSGSTFDMFITDGTNKQRKRVTYTYGLSEDQRLRESKLTFNDTLTGNGIVSFSEIVNVELDRKPDLNNISSCHIGTTMLVGEEIETAIDRIAKEAGMTTDTIQTQSVFTGNIVSSVNNNIVTCKKAVVGIEAGDVIYTHEGLPIGKVASVSGSSITFNDVDNDPDIDLWYTPLVNDELIRREKKTFIATNNFTEVSAFDAMNILASKKEMDFNVDGKHIDFRKLGRIDLLVKKKISYKTNRLFKVETNAALFAKASKVTVVGDRVSQSASEDIDGTEITFVDSTIKTRQDALVRAVELLQLHNSDTRRIKLTLERKGLETLEAGDVVSLSFDAQNIPSGNYIIFEIENVLSSQITMTVGTFDKTIAERLTELGTGQRQNTATTFSKNKVTGGDTTLFVDKMKIEVTNVTYTISGTSAVSNVGFDAKVGFFDDGASENLDAELDSSGTEVGFSRGNVSVIIKYDSED